MQHELTIIIIFIYTGMKNHCDDVFIRMWKTFKVSHSDGNECLLCSDQQEADESLNFEEQILEAAKSIAAATSALVKAASAAQRELVAQGKVWTCCWRKLHPECLEIMYFVQLCSVSNVFLSLCQVGAIPANAVDDGQWSQGLISAVRHCHK